MLIYSEYDKNYVPVLLKVFHHGMILCLVNRPDWVSCRNLLHPQFNENTKLVYCAPGYVIPETEDIYNTYWIGDVDSNKLVEIFETNKSATHLLKR